MTSSDERSSFFDSSKMHQRFSGSDEDDVEHNDDRALGAEDSSTAKDYASRMEEIMDSDEEGETAGSKLDSDFEYADVDAAESSAATASNYRDRLREVLGQDESTDDEGYDENVQISRTAVDEEDYLVCSYHFLSHLCRTERERV